MTASRKHWAGLLINWLHTNVHLCSLIKEHLMSWKKLVWQGLVQINLMTDHVYPPVMKHFYPDGRGFLQDDSAHTTGHEGSLNGLMRMKKKMMDSKSYDLTFTLSRFWSTVFESALLLHDGNTD